jgi:uncharacterized protein with HEPN domain
MHILECIAHVGIHTQNRRERFLEDLTAQDAALRKLQLLGESAKRLSPAVKEELPEVEWIKISGFRNILVHDYLGDIDYEIIWNVIEHKLPPLKQAITAYLNRKTS